MYHPLWSFSFWIDYSADRERTIHFGALVFGLTVVLIDILNLSGT